MLCNLILEGSYKDAKGFKQVDPQIIIPLFEDYPAKLSYENRVIGDAWYTVKLQLTGCCKYVVDRIDLRVDNEPVVVCKSSSRIIEEILEITLVFPEYGQLKEAKQFFLLYFDNIAIALDIYCGEECYRFGSDYIQCVSKNNEDYANVGLMIDTILNFEDDTVINWIYNLRANNTQDEYGFLEGSLKKDAIKSVFSFVQLLKVIHSCYHRNLYQFKNQTKHTVTSCDRVIPYECVKTFGNNEFVWLMQNSDQLQITSGSSAISYNEKSYLPQKIRASEVTRDKDVYENRIVYSFLKMIVLKLKVIKNKYSEELTQQKDAISKLRTYENEGFYCPIVVVKERQLNKGDQSLKELELLLESLSKLLLLYKDILGCEEVKLDRLPRKTKTFQAIKHYREVYELIIRWFKYGDFDLRKEELLLKVKKISKIFEYYCLIKLLKVAKDAGYRLDEQAGGACLYTYEVKDSRYKNEADENNTYHLTDGVNLLTIFYQPVIYSYNAKTINNIDLFRTNSYYDNHLVPDFIFKMQNVEESSAKYAILDPKYSNRGNIKDFYMDTELLKYACSIADKTGRTPAVRLMWLLQGRVSSSAQMENYHTSQLAKSIKPIPSYGIYTLNPTNSDVSILWGEILRCIM